MLESTRRGRLWEVLRSAEARLQHRPRAGDYGAQGPREDGLRLPMLQHAPDGQPGSRPVAPAIDDAQEKGH